MLSISENLPPFAKAESPKKQSALFLLNQHFQLSDCASTTWNKFYPDLYKKIVHRQHNKENKMQQYPAIGERDSVYLERSSGAAGAAVGWIKGFVAQRTIQGTIVIIQQKSCWSYLQKYIIACKIHSTSLQWRAGFSPPLLRDRNYSLWSYPPNDSHKMRDYCE